jgi:hypothetical protein
VWTFAGVVVATVGVIIAAVINSRGTNRKLDAVITTVDVVAKDTRKTELAVNNQEQGMPTMVERLTAQDKQSQATARELRLFRAWQTDAMHAVARELGIELPEQPAEVVTPPMAKPSD